MLTKTKRIRLKGKAKIKLYEAVYERDSGLCIKCSSYIEPGTIPHHEPLKSQGGQDRLEDLAMLCNDCHYRRHNSPVGVEIGEMVEKYLLKKYPNKTT